MKERVGQAYSKLMIAVKKLSRREQVVIGALLAYVLGWVLFQGVTSVQTLFADQSARLEKVNLQVSRLPQLIHSYQRLEARKDQIEQDYKEAVMEDGAIEHIESLIKKKDKIDQNSVRIVPKNGRRFGGNFEQLPFQVSFRISDFPQLVQLLSDMANGKEPLRLLRVEMKKHRDGSRLDVELDVSSVRRVDS